MEKNMNENSKKKYIVDVNVMGIEQVEVEAYDPEHARELVMDIDCEYDTVRKGYALDIEIETTYDIGITLGDR
jgi:hypothetical protein